MKRPPEIKEFLIESLDHLKTLCTNKNGDMKQFYIMFGFARSGKRIIYWPDDDLWSVVHEIDESSEELTTEKLVAQTNFLQAIGNQAFFFSDFQD